MYEIRYSYLVPSQHDNFTSRSPKQHSYITHSVLSNENDKRKIHENSFQFTYNLCVGNTF